MDFLTGYASDDEILEPQQILLCGICEKNKFNYKCPRCYMLTCSLDCCKQHKVQYSCNGQRDRTSYLSIQQFTESQIQSDFHFLEDVLQSKNRALRVLEDTGTPKENNNNNTKKSKSSNTIAPAVRKLIQACKRRDINLITISSEMTKRLINTSSFHGNIDTIFWRLQVIFINGCEFKMSELFQIDNVVKSNHYFQVRGNIIEYTIPSVKESKTVIEVIDDIFKTDQVIQIDVKYFN